MSLSEKEAKKLNVLQIGVGSMGKRRIRNLKYLGVDNITCFDIRKDRVEEAVQLYGVKGTYQIEVLNWKNYTHCIISTPPNQHWEYALKGIENQVHTFIEASVLDTGFDNIQNALNQHPEVVLAPSCTMRFDPIVKKAKSLIDAGVLGTIRIVSHYFGQYLPHWHPYEDIRDYYVSQKKTGAAREIVPFDLVFLTWLFGSLKEINAIITNTGDLEIDIDDIYTLTGTTHEGTLLQIAIEVLSQVSYRNTRVVGQHGNLEIDNVKGELRLYRGDAKSWQIFNRSGLQETYSTEDMYVQEMKAFLDATLGGEPFPYTLEDDHRILNLLYKAEEAYKNRKTIDIM